MTLTDHVPSGCFAATALTWQTSVSMAEQNELLTHQVAYCSPGRYRVEGHGRVVQRSGSTLHAFWPESEAPVRARAWYASKSEGGPLQVVRGPLRRRPGARWHAETAVEGFAHGIDYVTPRAKPLSGLDNRVAALFGVGARPEARRVGANRLHARASDGSVCTLLYELDDSQVVVSVQKRCGPAPAPYEWRTVLKNRRPITPDDLPEVPEMPRVEMRRCRVDPAWCGRPTVR